MKTTKTLVILLIVSVLANGFLTSLTENQSKELNLLRKEKKEMRERAQSLPEDQNFYTSSQLDFVLYNSPLPKPSNGQLTEAQVKRITANDFD